MEAEAETAGARLSPGEAQAATSEAAAAAALVRKAKAEEGIVRCQHFLHTSTVCFGTNGTVRTVL